MYPEVPMKTSLKTVLYNDEGSKALQKRSDGKNKYLSRRRRGWCEAHRGTW